MESFLTEHEPLVRLGGFLGVLVAMAAWETVAPGRSRVVARGRHALHNLGLLALDSAILRVVFPTAAVGAALLARDRGWGLFHLVNVSPALEVVLAFVLLDLAIYAQHVVLHHVPPLWRLHRVHHADLDLDVTSGARFHPLEILLSMLIKIGFVWLIGASVTAVVLFEVVLNGMAMFNHGNVRLPRTVERLARVVVVTPDVHRVHHSVHADETNSNYGFNLSCWDRLFGTYRAQPRDGHEAMTIGLTSYRDPRISARLSGMLMIPFRD